MSQKDSRSDVAYHDDYLLPGGHVYVDELHKLYVERSEPERDAPVLVLVPGMTGDAGEVRPLAALLGEDFSLVAIDRRGHSRSPHGWSKSSVDEQARDLVGLLDALAVGRAFVFAASMGAPAAIKAVMRFPARVAGVLLHEPWVPALLDDRAAFATALEAGAAEVVAGRERRNTGPFEGRMRWLMGGAFDAIPQEVRGRVFKNGEMHATERVFADDWLAPPPHLMAPHHAPIAISVGRDSRPDVQEMARRLAARLACGLVEVPGMHAAHLGDPVGYEEAVRPVLDGWLATAGGDDD